MGGEWGNVEEMASETMVMVVYAALIMAVRWS